jgi:rhodanese-related sulfurtransferase
VTDIVREKPGIPVVVNCAGRTRSIIGARTLQRMGIRNVVSLRNGTSGWTLAGLELEHGSTRTDLPSPSDEGRAAAEAFATRVAREDGVTFLDVEGLQQLLATAENEPVYFIDVRTDEEFREGHIPGFWWFPGGQAVQRADDVVAVRNGRIVFCCDGIARSAVTASYYRQMGFPNVYALDGGTSAWLAAGHSLEFGAADADLLGTPKTTEHTALLTPDDLHQLFISGEPPPILFVDPSDAYASAHIPGSRWLSRSWLELEVGEAAPDRSHPVVVTDVDGRGARLAVSTLLSLGYQRPSALDGGIRAWVAAGLPTERGLTGVMRPPADVVPAGTDRTYADMVHYLTWEEALGRKYAPE